MSFRSIAIFLAQLFLCLASAAMLFAAFPYPGLHYLAWFAFVPWFLSIENASRRRALLLSYLTGLLFWGGTVYWLIHVTLAGMIVMVLYLALYFAAFGFIVSTIRVQLSLAKTLFVPSVWVLLEFMRSHLLTGFPWALVAHTQAPQLELIQASDLTGAWGVSFLILAVNTALKGVLTRIGRGKRPGLPAVSFTALLLAAALGYGNLRLQGLSREEAGRCKVSVVQGNVLHEQKWREETRDAVMKTHLELTREASQSAPDLIVWSEAALPVILENEPRYFEQVRAAVKAGGIPLFLGAITRRQGSFFNSAILLLPSGEIGGVYDKLHLVPFGEYIPLRGAFPFLETLAPIGELSKGGEYSVFRGQGGGGKAPVNFAGLICFEDLFPEMARKFVSNGAQMLVNITNDAWYRFSAATYQHAQAAVFRAVENRVPLVRCANTGVSCFIDRGGKVTSALADASGEQLFIAGHAEESLSVAPPDRTFYNRYGDYFIWVCWFFVFVGAIMYFADSL